MGYLEDLMAARDRYAAELARQEPPPDYSWNEYEEFLVDQLERLEKLIAAAQASAQQAEAAAETEQISGAFTP